MVVPETTACWSECGTAHIDPLQSVRQSGRGSWVSSQEAKACRLGPQGQCSRSMILSLLEFSNQRYAPVSAGEGCSTVLFVVEVSHS